MEAPPDVRGWLSSPVPAAGKSSQGVRRRARRERCSDCERAAGSRPGQAAASLFQTRRPCARSAFLTRPRTPPQHCDAQVHGIGKRVGRNVRISPQKSRERKPHMHAEVLGSLKNATLSLLCPLAGPFGEEEKSSRRAVAPTAVSGGSFETVREAFVLNFPRFTIPRRVQQVLETIPQSVLIRRAKAGPQDSRFCLCVALRWLNRLRGRGPRATPSAGSAPAPSPAPGGSSPAPRLAGLFAHTFTAVLSFPVPP